MNTNQPAATLVVVVLVVLSLAVVPAAATAQEGDGSATSTTTQNSTAIDPATTPSITGDDELHVVDHWTEDGTMYVKLYAEQVRRVSISAPPKESGSQAGGYVITPLVQGGETRTVSIQAPTGKVWVSTKQSVQNGRFHSLRDSSGSLLSGPWTANDTMLATFGGALGVAAFVLYRAVEAHFGRDQQGERVA